MQPELTISEPHDVDEQEADRLAEALVGGPSRQPVFESRLDLDFRRIRVHANTTAATARGSGGAPLSSELRSYFEPRFGRELGGVRVHTDSRAAEAARSLQAEAFTVGGDIHFGEGTFTPGSERGRRLIAHELAHVVQHGMSPVIHRQAKSGQGLTDAEIDELLPEQAAADAELDKHASSAGAIPVTSTAAAPSAGGGPAKPSLWKIDHATHWSSFAERSRWVKSEYATAHFDSEAEQEYYAFIAQGIDIDQPRRPVFETFAKRSARWPSALATSEEGWAAMGLGKQDLRAARGPTDESRFWFTQSYPSGPRRVRTIEFTTARHQGAAKLLQPDFMAPVLVLGETTTVQQTPDPSAGYNFDTYLWNRATGTKVPAQWLGGTRFRVLMGSAQCPGCHFGHGLEVDLFGANFAILLGTMTLGGLGALGGGPEPIPQRPTPPPGGWTGPRATSIPGGRSDYIGTSARGSAPQTAGPTMSSGPYTGPSAAPKLALEPAPVAPQSTLKSIPMPTTPASGSTITPGPVSPAIPLVATQPAQPSQATQQNRCPPHAKTIVWPVPVWLTSGFGDMGALSPINNRPNRLLINRVRPARRSRALIRTYMRLSQNLPLVMLIRTTGLRGAIHHKWPLFVEGQDVLDNLVFLTNAMHMVWHNGLHAQGKLGWMTFDPVGTQYCVY